MRIGIDIMGGDYAPLETTLGAISALREFPAHIKIVLLGDRNAILPILKQHNISEESFDIIHTTEVIDMSDSPTRAFTQKPNSSIERSNFGC